jgi:hypothetical protein
MAAFFAINIDVFPVNEDGKLALDHVLKYMRKWTRCCKSLLTLSAFSPPLKRL